MLSNGSGLLELPSAATDTEDAGRGSRTTFPAFDESSSTEGYVPRLKNSRRYRFTRAPGLLGRKKRPDHPHRDSYCYTSDTVECRTLMRFQPLNPEPKH